MVKVPSGSQIVNKILQRADVVGGTFGLFERLGGISGAAYHVTQLVTHPVAPNWYDVFADAGTAIGIDVAIVIAGVAGQALDLENYNKYFSALAKFGMGKMMGSVLGSIMTHSHNPNGGGGRGGTQESPVWKMTRSAGPVTTSARKLRVTASQPSALPSN